MANSATPIPDNTVPKPGTSILQDTRTKSYREPYAPGVEFVIDSQGVYSEFAGKYPHAWVEYYGGVSQPSYSPENAVKFQEAIRFWEYNNIGETVTFPKPALPNTYGAPELPATGEDVKQPSWVANFAPRGGDATYENPEAFYDGNVYARTVGKNSDGTSGATGELPRAILNGSRQIADNPNDIFSSGYVTKTEYETTYSVPKTPYEWGGEYATSKRRY